MEYLGQGLKLGLSEIEADVPPISLWLLFPS